MITINNRKLKTVLSFLVLISVISTSCKKGTFDINDTNPNQPSTVSAKYSLSASLTATASYMFGGNSDILQTWMGYWAVSGDYTPSPTFVQYYLTTDTYSGNWDNGYVNLENYKLIEDQSYKGDSIDPTQSNYLAIAMIMKSFVYQRIVDLYNNAPYSDALSSANFTPAYTSASDIYKSLVNQIDSAINIINNRTADAEDPAEYDVMFAGDMDMWVKFANTLKLKILMRQTQIGADAYIKAELSGLTTDDFLGAGEDAAINPGYSAAADNQQNPLYLDIGYQINGSLGTNTNYFRANTYAVKFYYDNNDPRVNYFYEVKSDGLVHGRLLGSTDLEHNDAISGVNGIGVVQDPTQDSWILPAFESFFLQAEAIERGYLTGDPAAAYNSGVSESFRLLGVTDYATAAAAYTSQSNSKTNFSLASNKIQLIILQKWAACNTFDPLESFSDWRRLHIPSDLPVSIFPQNTATHVPYRLEYPTSEHSYNSVNVNAQGEIDIFNSKIFWMP